MVITGTATGFENRMNQELYNNRFLSDDSDSRITSANRIREPLDQRTGGVSVTGEVSYPEYSKVPGPDGRPYRTVVKQPLVGSDGASALPPRMRSRYLEQVKRGGGIDAAQKKITGYKKREGYPFIDFKDLSRNWYTMPIHYGLVKLFSLYTTPPEDRGTLASKIVGGMCDSGKKLNQQQLSSKLMDSFPKIMVWNDFANSTSIINEIYTVGWSNKEIPVYFRAKGGPAATDDVISEGIRFVRDKKTVKNRIQSPYNSISGNYDINKFYRQGFSRLAADKFTRGDYDTFIDPSTFNPWFVRDDSWYIQQYGTKTVEKNLTVDGTTYKVKCYEKPEKFSMWWYWFVGDMVYDFIDSFFDPVQETVGRLFTTEAQQDFVKSEYRMIAGVRRSMFDSPARLDLAYEL